MPKIEQGPAHIPNFKGDVFDVIFVAKGETIGKKQTTAPQTLQDLEIELNNPSLTQNDRNALLKIIARMRLDLSPAKPQEAIKSQMDEENWGDLS